MESKNILGERLRQLRKAKGMTQEELGAVLGRTKFNISNYEKGKRQPDNDTLRILSDFFDVSTDYLLGKTNVRHYVETLAFHVDGDLTEEELEEVKKYIKFLRSQRHEDE